LFTRTADENGGRERRQEDAALKKLHLKTIKRRTRKSFSQEERRNLKMTALLPTVLILLMTMLQMLEYLFSIL
jgi:ABC-type lipopolysaccharide export system ATPase subunit